MNARAQAVGAPAVLQASALGVRIGPRSLVEGIELTLRPGEVLGLAGESGSGKTLTALAIARLLPRAATIHGCVQLEGRDLAQLDEPELCSIRGRDLGFVFQEPATALNPLQTIGDQVGETLRIHERVSRRAALERAAAVLDRVGLPPDRVPLERHPHELSGGQRQRVAIAAAIAMTPKVLLADEPTTALDVTTQAQILRLLRGLVDETGMALVLVSHDLAVLASLADRIAVLRDGRIVEQGGVAELLRRPRAAYTSELLDSARLRPAGMPSHTAASSIVAARAASTAPAAPATPLLAVQDLACEYLHRRRRFRAVEAANFEILAGERVGLVGESAAGKSTLVRALLGLHPPSAGRVLIDGRALHGASAAEQRPLRRLVQAVFQDPYGSLDPRQRVERIVAEPLHLLDDPPGPAARRALVERLLASVGLDVAAADRYPHAFSGGQRQRIAIARALAVEPKLLVLDEAVSALDATLRRQILQLLESLRAERGLAWLFVSHDLEVVRAVTDRVLVMQAGRIVESGPTARVLDAPAHPYTRELLAASPGVERALAQRGL